MAIRMIIPIQAVPAQRLATLVNWQSIELNIYQRYTGLYVDVGLNGLLVIGGVLALDRNKIVRDTYRNFIGDIAFWDSQGTQDPDYTGLGTRFFLGYWLD
jgi:hypothetical protein